MKWFKCKHPLKHLVIATPETVKIIDEDFEKVTYHYKCSKCRATLSQHYTKCTGGVETFLSRLRLGDYNETTSK